jgi:hypothetical protein
LTRSFRIGNSGFIYGRRSELASIYFKFLELASDNFSIHRVPAYCRMH